MAADSEGQNVFPQDTEPYNTSDSACKKPSVFLKTLALSILDWLNQLTSLIQTLSLTAVRLMMP